MYPALYTGIITVQALWKNNVAIWLWSVVTIHDCIRNAKSLPNTVWIHHLGGLLTCYFFIINKVQTRSRFSFVWLETGLLSTRFIKHDEYSLRSFLLHILVLIFIRWPILIKGGSSARRLGYSTVSAFGYLYILLDIYWFKRLLDKRDRKKHQLNNSL